MKANRYRRMIDDRAMIEGGGWMIGGALMLSIGIVVNLALLPVVQDGSAAAKENPNGTTGEKGIVSIYPLVFAAIPLLGIFGMGFGGYRYAKSAG